MKNFTVNTIGNMCVVLDKIYISALKGAEEFGYLTIVWWFDKSDNQESRSILTEKSPYKDSPDFLGTFATRSHRRPNPIALTTSYITHIDFENGIIGLAFTDAEDGSPVLDIKPYTPSFDRVETPTVPQWCEKWPRSLEDSSKFDWSSVFNF